MRDCRLIGASATGATTRPVGRKSSGGLSRRISLRHVVRLAVIGSIAATTLAIPATSADSASRPLQGVAWNETPYGVLTGRDWCDANQGPCAGSPLLWIYQGQRTPVGEDWDTLRVDAGWCYKVRLDTYYPYPPWKYTGLYTFDRRGKSHWWFKFTDNQTATVYFQSTSSCG